MALGGIRRLYGLGAPPARVLVIQCALAHKGASIVLDGVFGAQTREKLDGALVAYQIAGGTDAYEDPDNGASAMMVDPGFYAWLVGGTGCETMTNGAGTNPSGSSSAALVPTARTLPSCFQLVILPLNISPNCFIVRLSTLLPG